MCWPSNAVFARSDVLSLANNIVSQAIGQGQSSVQNALCLAGISDSSCNNTSVQNQVNHGGNALSQISGLGFGLGGRHHHDDDANVAGQSINQGQSSVQNANCVSGSDLDHSCNNTSVQNQVNHGNNAAAQHGGNGFHAGDDANVASQSVNQGQSNSQFVQCVSGESLSNSCNNTSVQNQVNHGNNALSQQGGSSRGSGGGPENVASQSINQEQSSNQNAQCVSGKDAIVSCNNLDFQKQVNTGSNVLSQSFQ
ncbi:MAG TPA: hypothetical protein VIY08_11260 [Candidatus Nitrosocosmicus sp.]